MGTDGINGFTLEPKRWNGDDFFEPRGVRVVSERLASLVTESVAASCVRPSPPGQGVIASERGAHGHHSPPGQRYASATLYVGKASACPRDCQGCVV